MMRKLILSVLLITLLLPGGCWDMREINEIGLVMAVGIDKSSRDPNLFWVTVQVANPQGSGSSGGGDKEKNESQVWIASAEGRTIFDAIREIARFSSQRIMWAHNNIIVVGESLAREDITPVIDFFTHNYELRMKTWVAITPLQASDIIKSNAGMGNIPGRAITEVFRFQKLTGLGLPSDLLNVFHDFSDENNHILISRLTLNQALTEAGLANVSENIVEQIEISGMAVFHNTRMLGYLSADEARGLSWFLGEEPNSVISLPHPENSIKAVAVEMRSVHAKIESRLNQDMPEFTIEISGTGHITEEDISSSLTMDEFKSALEGLAEQQIATEVRSSVSKVQKEFRSDVLKFGSTVHVQHKKEWNQDLKYRWAEIFPEVEVEVVVNVSIDSSTLNQIPQRNYKERS